MSMMLKTSGREVNPRTAAERRSMRVWRAASGGQGLRYRQLSRHAVL